MKGAKAGSKTRSEYYSGASNRRWRRRFEENLDELVELGSLSPGLADAFRRKGLTFETVDDYRSAVEGRERGLEPGEDAE